MGTLGPMTPGGTAQWKPLRVGAGGFLTGIDIAADGEKVVRTDTYGAYRWNSSTSQWEQLVTASGMGLSTYLFHGSMGAFGVYEICIAPSNTQRYYMIWFGDMYRTDNRGASWTKLTGFTRDTDMDTGGSTRYYGQKMAVDPNDEDTVYVGTPSRGVWYTHNAGANWTQIATGTITFGAEHFGIAFDPASGTDGNGYTNTVIVPSSGHGVWRTTNAGANWSQLLGAPTAVIHGRFGQSNHIYHCISGTIDDGTYYRYASGSWSSVALDGRSTTVALDFNDDTTVVVVNGAGQLTRSTNSGATFGETSYQGSATRTAPNIPWHAWTNEDYMSCGDAAIDPVDGKLYLAEGIGVFTTDVPTSGQTVIDWTEHSKGVEQLVAQCVWTVPGGTNTRIYVAAWDRPVFTLTDPDVFPSEHGPDNTDAIVRAYTIEHAYDDPTFIVMIADDHSAYSDDSGDTWTRFAAEPTAYGGLAAKTTENWVWAGSNVYYTTNHGGSWSACPSPANASCEANPFYRRQLVCTDGTYFYLYLPSIPAVLRSSTGASWTTQHSGHLVSIADGFNVMLKSVPGETGHLFCTNGQYGGGDHADADEGEIFVRSTDGGANWSTVANVYEVYNFGFGKAKPGGSYPTIFVAGYVGGTGAQYWGVWMSDDDCSTWTRLGDTPWPCDSMDRIDACYGDMNVYGRCYIGLSGSGWAYWG